MTWFFIALLVAIGGIWTAYARSKGMKASDAAVRAKMAEPAPSSRGSARIDINDLEDLRRWAKELGIDEWDLKGAIQDVGVEVEAVKSHLAAR